MKVLFLSCYLIQRKAQLFYNLRLIFVAFSNYSYGMKCFIRHENWCSLQVTVHSVSPGTTKAFISIYYRSFAENYENKMPVVKKLNTTISFIVLKAGPMMVPDAVFG